METKKQDNQYYLVFSIEKEVFAINIENTLEVMQKMNITQVPDSSTLLPGIINYRGEILPIVEARQRLNFKQRGHDENFVIIVLDLMHHNDKLPIGILVDKVIDVIKIQAKEITPIPETGINFDKNFTLGKYAYKDGFAMVLEPSKTFIIEELFVSAEL